MSFCHHYRVFETSSSYPGPGPRLHAAEWRLAASVRLRKKWEIDSAFPATAKTYFFVHSGIRSADLAFSASDRVRSPQVTAGNDRPCAVLERRVDLSF